jgi:glycine cleavage system regulatory protein
MPMQASLAMTIIGPDRPGLVDLIARTVREHDGNWLESRMSHLGGQFAGILRVEVPAEREPALRRALEALQAQGLTIVVHAERDTAAVPANDSASIEFVGQDRPGIVSQISAVIARHGVNVEELETECESAPMSGETLFRARARLHLPESCDVPAFRRDLEKIAADLMVEISFAKTAGAAAR